eukprot:6057543-Pleurochrysis_carterae.AAC.2
MAAPASENATAQPSAAHVAMETKGTTPLAPSIAETPHASASSTIPAYALLLVLLLLVLLFAHRRRTAKARPADRKKQEDGTSAPDVEAGEPDEEWDDFEALEQQASHVPDHGRRYHATNTTSAGCDTDISQATAAPTAAMRRGGSATSVRSTGSSRGPVGDPEPPPEEVDPFAGFGALRS